MSAGGQYDLVHPNARAVNCANSLWFRFGEEPEFRDRLDLLYPRVTPLLDVTTNQLIPTSSLQDHAAEWRRLEAAMAELNESPELLGQVEELREFTYSWGLRCDWAPYSLLHTLGEAHGQRTRWRADRERYMEAGLQDPYIDLREPVPRWSGPDPTASVHSGLINPQLRGIRRQVLYDS